jgi:pilus assembly protein Flp/PilA
LTEKPTQETENSKMNEMILKMYVNLKTAMAAEEGQDLVEYALVVAIIAFGAVAGMGFLATGINQAFSTVATKLAADI